MNQAPKLTPQYVADVAPVREVSLLASANVAYWQAHLAAYELHPTEHSGRAQIMITGAAARFKGIPFRELSISVGVCRERGGDRLDGFFLLHAFNSVRFFAFVERTLFSTPYYFARVGVEVQPRPRVAVETKGQTVLEAALGLAVNAAPLAASREEFATWEGPLFLPSKSPGDERRVFFARLEGQTQHYPFDATRDVFRITPQPAAPSLAWLLESECAPQEWIVRTSARHAKSKTVRRIRALGFDG